MPNAEEDERNAEHIWSYLNSLSADDAFNLILLNPEDYSDICEHGHEYFHHRNHIDPERGTQYVGELRSGVGLTISKHVRKGQYTKIPRISVEEIEEIYFEDYLPSEGNLPTGSAGREVRKSRSPSDALTSAEVSRLFDAHVQFQKIAAKNWWEKTRSLCMVLDDLAQKSGKPSRVFLSLYDYCNTLLMYGHECFEPYADRDLLQKGWVGHTKLGRLSRIGVSHQVPTGKVVVAPSTLTHEELEGLEAVDISLKLVAFPN